MIRSALAANGFRQGQFSFVLQYFSYFDPHVSYSWLSRNEALWKHTADWLKSELWLRTQLSLLLFAQKGIMNDSEWWKRRLLLTSDPCFKNPERGASLHHLHYSLKTCRQIKQSSQCRTLSRMYIKIKVYSEFCIRIFFYYMWFIANKCFQAPPWQL